MRGIWSAASLVIGAWAVFVTTTAMLTALTWVGGTILTFAGAAFVLWARRRLQGFAASSRKDGPSTGKTQETK